MSRQAITSIYETAIASRPQTRELLNEITNSNKMVERFNQAYGPWFPFGSSPDEGKGKINWRWAWSWPNGPGISTQRVENYIELVQKMKYPYPGKIANNSEQVIGQSRGSFNNVIVHSLDAPTLRKAEEYLNIYYMLFQELLEKAYKINAEIYGPDKFPDVSKIKDPAGAGMRAKGFMPFVLKMAEDVLQAKFKMWTIELKRSDRARWDAYDARFVLNSSLINFVFLYFAKIQNIMPIKDILRYGNVLDLLQAMNSAQSNRSKTSTKSANIKEEIPGKVFEDDTLIVVEPPSWQFSHRYFGEVRRSLYTPGRIIRGANWCTSSSDQSHFDKYTKVNHNHLYYFLRRTKEEEVGALRTCGAVDNFTSDIFNIAKTDPFDIITAGRALYEKIREEAANTAYLNRLHAAADSNKLYKMLMDGYMAAGFRYDDEGRDIGEEKNKKALKLFYEAFEAIKLAKQHTPKSYCNLFTFELRNQANGSISYEDFITYFFGEGDYRFFTSHLKFCSIFD